MEIGFILAIVGIVVVLLATIWFFASMRNQIIGIASTVGVIKKPDGSNVTHATQCTPSTIVDATADNISLKETILPSNGLITTSTAAIIGWVIGGIMIVGGGIWGLVATVNKKKDTTLGSLLPSILASQPQAVAVATPAAPASLSPTDVALLKALLAAKQTA